MAKFVSIAVSNEFEQDQNLENYVLICESDNGIIYHPVATYRDYWGTLVLGNGGQGGAHNIGISSDGQGHIDIDNPDNFVAHGYGLRKEAENQLGYTAGWPTLINKIKIVLSFLENCSPSDDDPGDDDNNEETGAGGFGGGGGCFIN